MNAVLPDMAVPMIALTYQSVPIPVPAPMVMNLMGMIALVKVRTTQTYSSEYM